MTSPNPRSDQPRERNDPFGLSKFSSRRYSVQHIPLVHVLDLTRGPVVVLGTDCVVHAALVDVASAVGRQRAVARAGDDPAALQGRFVAGVGHHVIQLVAGYFQRHG